MRKMINIALSTLLFLQLGTSCKKEPTMSPCTNNGSDTTVLSQDFELIWSVLDSRGFTSYGTVVTPSSVVYFYDPPGGGGDDIVALNKLTGDTLWIKQAQGSTSLHKLIGNSICYRGGSDKLYCLDISTGNQLWDFNGANGFIADFIGVNNKVYAFVWGEGGVVGDSTRLFSLDPVSGISTKLHTIYKSNRNGYRQRPKGMVYFQHPNGNEIIFTQSSGYNNSLIVSRGEYYAIDITNDSMYWDLGTHFSEVGIGSPPQIKNNLILLNGPWSQHSSINIETKMINWLTQAPNTFRTGGGEMEELNGRLFQSLGNASNLNIINTIDGSFYKNYNTLGSDNWSPTLMKYNNHIYFSSTEGFYKMDGNGTIIKQLLKRDKLSENDGGTLQTFDIDPTNGYIYCTVGYSLVCMKEK